MNQRTQRGPWWAAVIAFIAMTCLVFVSQLPFLFSNTPPPEPWGMPIAGVAIAATLLGFLFNALLSDDGVEIEKFAIEVSVVAVAALFSLTIMQRYDPSPMFPAGVAIMNELGRGPPEVTAVTSLQAAISLTKFSTILVIGAVFCAWCSHKISYEPLSNLFRILTILITSMSYIIFFVTLMYVR